VFEPSTRPANGIEDHRILLLDGHSAHVGNYDYINDAINHNIHLICLPSHATHVLQPLDVGIFGPLSTYYKQELEDRVRQLGPYGKIKKGDVFHMLQGARLKTFTEDNIQSAWRACGLIPFSPERTLNNPVLQEKIAPTSAKINLASEARAPCPDASDVVFPSFASPASGRHSKRRLRPDVTSDLTHIPPPPHISCSSPPPYLTS